VLCNAIYTSRGGGEGSTKDCKIANALFLFVPVADLPDFGQFLTLPFLKTLNSTHYSNL